MKEALTAFGLLIKKGFAASNLAGEKEGGREGEREGGREGSV